MSEVKFKVGDLVYCPEVSHKILKIDTIEYDCIYFEVGEFGLKIFTNDDFLIWENWIFHATQENYELLSKIYPNVTFEPPPKRKEPKEIIKAMFDDGWKHIPCKSQHNNGLYAEVIIEYMANNGKWDGYWGVEYTIPFDPKTGKTIIDFVDGEVVLESENE